MYTLNSIQYALHIRDKNYYLDYGVFQGLKLIKNWSNLDI